MTFIFCYQLSYRGNRAGFKANHLKPELHALMNIGELKLSMCVLFDKKIYVYIYAIAQFGTSCTISLVFNNIINDSN